MGKQITDYFLYQWRYFLGYSLIGLLIVCMLIVAGMYIPGGLARAEMDSVTTSNAIMFSLDSFDPHMVVDLPYHLLQRLSLELFGVSPISIKLPSLILGLFSALGMLMLLRMWFRQNVAVLTTILVITTGQFLFVAQSGTASVVYLFWSIWLLVAAMMISRGAKLSLFWTVLLFVTAALSLYTPLSLYILLALVSAMILHPHLRYLARRLSKPELLFATLCAVIIVAPLGYVIVRQPMIGFTLLGIPNEWPNLQANIMQLLRQYLDFVSPSSGVVMTPIYGLGSMILIALGIVRLVTTKYTARSYIIVAWVVLLLPVLVINPNYVSVTFVPVILLMAMGIQWLLTRWYRLFPRNPYARLAGLVPLAVLIGGMVFSGVDRYTYGYLYSPQIASNFSKDLQLINNQLHAAGRDTTVLVVAQAEAPFYNVLASHHKGISVVVAPATFSPSVTTIVSHDAHLASDLPPQQIMTNSASYDSDRFYIYKTDTK